MGCGGLPSLPRASPIAARPPRALTPASLPPERAQSVVPVRYRHDKQLVSHNIHESTYNYKYTFSVEIAPICKVCVCVCVCFGGALGPLAVVVPACVCMGRWEVGWGGFPSAVAEPASRRMHAQTEWGAPRFRGGSCRQGVQGCTQEYLSNCPIAVGEPMTDT